MRTTRFHNVLPTNSDDLGELIQAGHIPVIQFGDEPAPAILERVDDLCRDFGPNLNIRFFAFNGREFDTSILRRIPHVANLSIDTVHSISHVTPIAELERLTRLHFGVYLHPDGAFLRALQLDRFTHLTLTENKLRNFDLSPLADAKSLRKLFVQGHYRGIAEICGLPHLDDVSLSGFPKRHDLAFLGDLVSLRSLFLILGTRTSISEFTHSALCKLRIVWVRLLEDLGPLQRFSSLEDLEIEDQLRLATLDITGLELRRLRVSNCKNLERIAGLDAQHELRELSIDGTKVPAHPQPQRS